MGIPDLHGLVAGLKTSDAKYKGYVAGETADILKNVANQVD
jgi:hypothetical protein